MNITLVLVILIHFIILMIKANEAKNIDNNIVSSNSLKKKKHCNSSNCPTNSSSINSNEFKFKGTPFVAGHDIDGQPLFVCRVKYLKELIPGKYSPLRNKCMITYDKKEYQFERYQLLIESQFGSYNWIQVKKPAKQLPNNIVMGGSNLKDFYYISQCRVHSEKIHFISEQIGKVHWNHTISEWVASVPFAGQEIECFDYSVLTMI